MPEPFREERCEGAGKLTTETPEWGTVICPDCRGIARTEWVDGEQRIDDMHTVRVLVMD